MANGVAETVIGAVVLASAAGFVLYASQTSGRQLARDSFPLTASFRSAQGIVVGTDVRLAGIKVGTVTALDLDPATYQAAHDSATAALARAEAAEYSARLKADAAGAKTPRFDLYRRSTSGLGEKVAEALDQEELLAAVAAIS